jgi:hypothetical protein
MLVVHRHFASCADATAMWARRRELRFCLGLHGNTSGEVLKVVPKVESDLVNRRHLPSCVKELVCVYMTTGGPVLKKWPTEIGDVLILRTSQSYTAYAVGAVVTGGQQDFSHSEQVRHVGTHAEAVETAKTLVAPGRHIYLSDIDTGEWSEILD